jgi:PII-like signaling protein
MNGYQITFYTQQDRRIHGVPVGEWLIELTKELGLHGATLQAATEGFGRSGTVHSAHFVELADQPIEVVTIVTGDEADRLLARLRAEDLSLFYVKVPVEFGTLGN